VFAIASCGFALTCRGIFRQNLALLGAALLSAVPAANLINWISGTTQNVRYLYIPAVFICLMIAASARSRRWLAALVIANGMGVTHNVRSYRTPITIPETAGALRRSDCPLCRER
jgi:hypothetical protein